MSAKIESSGAFRPDYIRRRSTVLRYLQQHGCRGLHEATQLGATSELHSGPRLRGGHLGRLGRPRESRPPGTASSVSGDCGGPPGTTGSVGSTEHSTYPSHGLVR